MKQANLFHSLESYLLFSMMSLLLLASCSSLTGSQGDGRPAAAVIPDAATGRDFILTYLNRKYNLTLVPEGTAWEESDLIADPDSPSQAIFYSSSTTTVLISYPTASPASRQFNITVQQAETGFRWNGFLGADGQVIEITVDKVAAALSATPTLTPSKVPLPTETQIPPAATSIPTLPFTPTYTPSPAPTATATATPDPCNWASFAGDITIPDGTTLAPGTSFTKIWRLKNVGSCTWTPDYDLVFAGGDLMEAPQRVALPRDVRPGESLDLAVTMRAPQRVGEYRSFWMLQNPTGDQFGLGAAANLSFWVSVNVLDTQGGYRYDFSLNLCSAIWRSAAGRLTCTNTTDTPDGYVRLLQNPALESGRENENALWLHPNETLFGWIDGTFPYFKIAKGDRFRAAVGCLEGYGACNLTFYLNYEDEEGRVNRLGAWQEIYDGSITSIDLDLSALAGRSVRFILGVEANIQDTDDAQGFWLLPRLENP